MVLVLMRPVGFRSAIPHFSAPSLSACPLFIPQDTRTESNDGDEDDSSSNVRYSQTKTLLFYLWMGIIYSYCLYVVLFVFRRLKEGLSETLQARLATVRRAQSYVLGYSLFWFFPLVFSFIDFILGNSLHQTLRSLSAFFLAIRGLFSMFILLIPNWVEMKTFLDSTGKTTDGLVQDVVEEDLSLRPHLNSVLRAEIIFFTTQVRSFSEHNPPRTRTHRHRDICIISHPIYSIQLIKLYLTLHLYNIHIYVPIYI
jgi:hypothetical protein